LVEFLIAMKCTHFFDLISRNIYIYHTLSVTMNLTALG